jgi:ABC-type bacteriocin/lantibiotic exporter with double-glycine peptidase domain
MELGILVMIIIIFVALAVVFAVMYFGSQHDSHTSIRSVESSRSVQTLKTQEIERAKMMEARQRTEENAASKLGDDEEALAQKAARQATE